MISGSYRFHGHNSLRYVYKNGEAVRSRILTIKYIRNTRRQKSRFAVVVSKKVHKAAVGRNRIRRRIYELIRHEIDHIPQAYDVVVIVSSSELIDMNAEDLALQLSQLLEQTTLYDAS